MGAGFGVDDEEGEEGWADEGEEPVPDDGGDVAEAEDEDGEVRPGFGTGAVDDEEVSGSLSRDLLGGTSRSRSRETGGGGVRSTRVREGSCGVVELELELAGGSEGFARSDGGPSMERSRRK